MKERQNHSRQNGVGKNNWYESPLAAEVAGQTFHRDNTRTLFKDQILPAHFNITVPDNEVLTEGQEIGHTPFGQILYWRNNQVVCAG